MEDLEEVAFALVEELMLWVALTLVGEDIVDKAEVVVMGVAVVEMEVEVVAVDIVLVIEKEGEKEEGDRMKDLVFEKRLEKKQNSQVKKK